MKKFFGEFKKFISRGNVMDMAVGIIIGAAFKAIVDSLVADIINPVLGLLGGKDLSSYQLHLKGDAYLRYGKFLSAIISFLILAFVLFCIIKLINGMNDLAAKLAKKKEEEAPPAAPTTKKCPFCKTDIAIDATRCPHCTSQLEE